MGNVANVGLYYAGGRIWFNDKTFEIEENGTVEVVDSRTGKILLSHVVEKVIFVNMCKTKKISLLTGSNLQ